MTPIPQQQNFAEYRRLGADALLMTYALYLGSFLQKFWILILFILAKGNSSLTRTLIALAVLGSFIVIGIIFKSITYLTTYVKIEEQKLFYKSGWINKEMKILPLENIHTIRTKSGVIYRLLDMVKVSFDSVISSDVEIDLLLNTEDFGKLLDRIHSQGEYLINVSDSMDKSTTKAPLDPEDQKCVLRSTTKDSLLGALCQHHLKGLGILLSFILMVGNETYDLIIANLETVSSTLTRWWQLSHWTGILSLILLIYIVIMIVWVGLIVGKQYGAYIRLSKDKIHYESGLWTRRTIDLPKHKITAIKTKSNALEKLMGIVTLSIEQSDAVEGKKGKDRLVIFGWRYPKVLIYDWYGVDSVCRTNPLRPGKGFQWYTLLLWIILFVVPIVATTYIYHRPLCWLAAPIALLISIYSAYLRYQKAGIYIDTKHLILYSGVYANQQTFIPLENIESLELRQTLIQKRSGRTKIVFNTMAGNYYAYSLPLSDAQKIRDYILYKTEIPHYHN